MGKYIGVMYAIGPVNFVPPVIAILALFTMVPRNRAGGRPVAGTGAPTSGLAPLTITSILIVTHSKSLRTTIVIVIVGRHNVPLNELTTPCRCTTRRSVVRDHVPVQASRPAPTRRPAARPSLPIQTIHVARDDILLYILTTRCRCTKKKKKKRRSTVRDYVPA